ncbi:helix-turn-helix domain-containing protein [Duganella sp. Root1480D1]|uniref:helix-turn-helix domain-containing protein n=1 Tax=Duganella sp. Root1480D1 TaxID=1736471 RepID=UPI0009EA7836|nr:helix-turn-helix domain-containing protein [Duganella sp. Root1480D1]
MRFKNDPSAEHKRNGGHSPVRRCLNSDIATLRRTLGDAGLLLCDSSTEKQGKTLLKILKFLGERGLNTPEGFGLGFARLATRIFELIKQGWLIDTVRENVVTADGLMHIGVARYFLRGRCADFLSAQIEFDFSEVK